ncbi:MAG: sugar ABC transporter ATP-binding protein [Clostridia bacterium]|nr:sugar ABC transporter ATP-binding protein [Clostridia bacterium]
MAEKLRVENIVKSYPGVVAVNDVSFEVLEGEVLALLGENGAGKSTMSKMICGVEKPDSGKILLDGKAVSLNSALDARNHGVAMVHQELSMVGEMSVAENIFMNRQPINALGNIRWHKLYEDTANLLKSFRLDINPRLQVKRLPVGMQQLLEIIRATSMGCKLIILDEPTSSLADEQIQLMFDNINRLRKEGYSFIYITHKLAEVMEIADRVVVMRDGCKVGERSVKDLTVNEIITMMVGREIKQLFGEELKERTLSQDCVFEVKNLCAEPLYRNVNFGVRAGEIVGVAGLIGAGRTEMALGIVHAHKRSGSILIKGREVKISSPKDAIKHGIAYVTEDRKALGLYLDYSIKNNLLVMQLKNLSNRMGMLKRSGINELAKRQVEDFRVATPSIEQSMNNLSGGNQQKCLLAMWLGIDPEVFIIDEPTRGIDVGAKAEIYQMLKNLAEKGKAVVVISSELTELLGICDRIVVMASGTVQGEVEKENFSEKAVMNYAMRADNMEILGEAL